MAEETTADTVRAGFSEHEMRDRVVRLVFGADARRLEAFCEAIRKAVPEDTAAVLVPLRRRLMDMVGRPVNIQGTRDWIMFVREHVMGQPYLTLIGKVESP
jgi:hypothetical protein